MRHTSIPRLAATAFLVAAGGLTFLPAATASAATTGVIANYDGHQIDLADGWDGAQACWTDGVTTDCYDTAAEMTAAHPSSEAPAAALATPLATPLTTGTCSFSTFLWDQEGFDGNMLSIDVTGEWVNLSDFGFADVTQSYAIGACAAEFTDAPDGGGDVMPTSDTPAFFANPVMPTGWSDAVESVFLS